MDVPHRHLEIPPPPGPGQTARTAGDGTIPRRGSCMKRARALIGPHRGPRLRNSAPGAQTHARAGATRRASSTGRSPNATAQRGPQPAAQRLERFAPLRDALGDLDRRGAGGAVAAALTAVIMLRPSTEPAPAAGDITSPCTKAAPIDVLIDSERELDDATIRIVATRQRGAGWIRQRTTRSTGRPALERGSNLLSLPVVARSAGKGQLVAVIEHEGRTRRMTINLTVRDT